MSEDPSSTNTNLTNQRSSRRSNKVSRRMTCGHLRTNQWIIETAPQAATSSRYFYPRKIVCHLKTNPTVCARNIRIGGRVTESIVLPSRTTCGHRTINLITGKKGIMEGDALSVSCQTINFVAGVKKREYWRKRLCQSATQ